MKVPSDTDLSSRELPPGIDPPPTEVGSPDPSDDALMERTAAGDREAFGVLVERHHLDAWRVAIRFSGDPEEARDLLQASFLKIFEKAPGYRPEGRFPGYLRTVVARTCLDASRKRRALPSSEVGTLPAPEEAGPPEQVERAQRHREVRAGVLDLAGNQRLAVILRYFRGASYGQIGEALGLGPRAVEGLLRRARSALLERLRGVRS